VKRGKLLIVAPHNCVFVRDQTELIRTHFDRTTILIPIPYFSRLATSVPIFSSKFSFLNLPIQSIQMSRPSEIIACKYLALPNKYMRERAYAFAAQASTKEVTRRGLTFDLVHSHFADLSGHIGAILKREYHKPFVLTAHGSEVYSLPNRSEFYRRQTAFTLSQADRIIAVSRFIAERLLVLGARPERVRVIPNGYDANVFRPIPIQVARSRLSLPPRRRIILTVGSTVPAKGHFSLIEGLREVIKRDANVLLMIIGSGPLKAQLERTVKKEGLSNHVTFLGQVNHEWIPFWMNACDLFVLPSMREGFPTVLPEAMACGKPIVATQVGGIPEILVDEELGLLVKPGQPPALSSAIDDALRRKWNTEHILAFARSYSWQHLVPRILEVYDEALDIPIC
jgi:glycosyltransferase involved in cell wall biosynthesis